MYANGQRAIIFKGEKINGKKQHKNTEFSEKHLILKHNVSE